MKRREFITLLGGAAVWPLAARALQGKLPTIGFLGSGTAATQSQWTGAFVQRLRELGWSEGRDVAIEYRWAEDRNERAAEIAAEFVRLKVDVIVTYGTQSILAAKQATTIIPIVFALPGDPVATGLVAQLAVEKLPAEVVVGFLESRVLDRRDGNRLIERTLVHMTTLGFGAQ